MESKDEKKNRSVFVCARSAKLANAKDPEWYLDSEALEYMTYDLTAFTTPFSQSNEDIYLADGSKIRASGHGTITLDVHIDGVNQKVDIKDVYYCPELESNLLLLGSFEAKGYSFLRKNGYLRVLDDCEVALEGARSGNLYCVTLSNVPATQYMVKGNLMHTSFKMAIKPDLELWHQCLSHLNTADIQKLATMATGIDSKVLGGYHFHSDLAGGGKTLTTYGGSHDFLIIVDDAICYRWFIPMAKKNQTQVEIKQFIPMESIQAELSAPYNQSQNGVSERLIQIIVKKAQTNLLAAGLPAKLWAEAINFVTYVLNRSPTSVLAVTLYEVLEKNKLDLEMLHVFGCDAYVFDEKSKVAGKMAARTWKGMLLGYKGTNQYRIWDPINSKDSLLTEAVGASNSFGIDVTELILTEISLKKGVNSVLHTISGSKQQVAVTANTIEEDTQRLLSYQQQLQQPQETSGPPAPQFSTTPPPSPSKKVLKGKWVYKEKELPMGAIKHKARWVVKGYEQIKGINYDETFASVVKTATVKHVEQMDVVTAFLYGTIDGVIYVVQPTGFEVDGIVCLLNKALYGLKQSPRIWQETVKAFYESIGYTQSEFDYGLYCDLKKSTYVAIYIDNKVLFGPNVAYINKVKEALLKSFKMTNVGPRKQFLGMEISRTPAEYTVKITQAGSIIFRENCKIASTPMDPGVILIPDIAYAVSKLGHFNHRPTSEHWKALKRVLRYLAGMQEHGVTFGRNNSNPGLIGWTDSSYGNNPDDSRSMSGYILLLNGGPVSWASSKQQSTALSTCEAKYMAQCFSATEAVWLRGLLDELGIPCNAPTMIHADNQGVLTLSKNPKYHKKSKHIHVRYHYTRKLIATGVIELKWLLTAEIKADGLIKALLLSKFKQFIGLIGLQDAI
ncbi:MAG: Retrovirus-related Pol poly from transposon TNT 1-94 [Lasallia pustulata]|uniref:Retrovirus-related Pol poly from transposon TNT 1-94 n=1 Tax=Lasallia pustulata TaxID=136370 RepID=A0A5M8PMT3_9LECA|nr:MAG: Retrovirus-related Pol poly from transposon TNT 1-94 [Lasallia pustulata]